jgi:Na+/melibiose symporter-like transporter
VTATAQPHPIDSRRNIAGFSGDITFFVSATAFIPASTVLVGLASRLTEDKTLIGAVGMVWAVMWFLPQLVAARIVKGKTRYKPYVVIPSVIGRFAFLSIAAWLFLTQAAQPLLTVWFLLITLAVFNVCDSLASIGWFDVLGRMLTPKTRGRVVTFAQIISGVIGIGVSEFIKRILDNDAISFPNNYAMIFLGAFLCMAISLFLFLLVKENPSETPPPQEATQHDFLQSLRHSFRNDDLFRRVLIVRFLTGLELMAASFYLVFIKEKLNLADSVDGTFTQMLIVGGLVGISIFGWLAERFTARRVIHASSMLHVASPLLALVVSLMPSTNTALTQFSFFAFVFVFLFRGALDHSLMLGTLGYLIDNTPHHLRGMYIGALNTLGGIVSMTPVLGGAWIDSFGHRTFNAFPYSAMFGVVMVFAATGLLYSLRLPRARHM